MWGWVGIIVAAIVVLFIGCNVWGLEKVDVGYAGVVIDYTKNNDATHPYIERVAPGKYIKINPVTQKLAKFPTTQFSMIMVRNTNEGPFKGDDSVECHDNQGIPVNVDSRTVWRADPEHVGELYILHPNTPINDDTNKDIETLVVRGNTRNAIVDGCSLFGYREIKGPKRTDVSLAIEKDLRAKLAQNYILLDQFQLGEVYLHKEQDQAISDQANAENAAITAQYTVTKNEQDAKAAIARSEGEKQSAILKAQGEAESIRIHAEAEAGAIKQISDALKDHPEYTQYRLASQWDGHMPQYIAGNGVSPALILQPTATPTR